MHQRHAKAHQLEINTFCSEVHVIRMSLTLVKNAPFWVSLHLTLHCDSKYLITL